MFLKPSLLGLAMGVLLVFPVGSQGAMAEDRPSDPFTIDRVPVDVTASDANTAQKKAQTQGQRAAFNRLLQRLTLAADRAKLLQPSDTELTDLVESFEVSEERRSSVRYIAKYTVHFQADSVRALLRKAGIAFADDSSKHLVVLAVLQQGGRNLLWDDPNPWREAWSGTLNTSGLVPLILPLGEAEDVSAIDGDGAIRADGPGLEALSRRYGNADVLIARALVNEGGGLAVTATRLQPGASGGQSWTATYTRNAGESEAEFYARAAEGTRAQVEDAWKVATLLNFSQAGDLVATVPGADLASWVGVRERLAAIPAIERTDLLALDRSGARITIHYVGDEAQLRLALTQRDLELAGQAPDWILRRRRANSP